jgi:hypothetical protein
VRQTIVAATFVSMGAGAVGVGATEIMKGSDTLFEVTSDVVATCLDKVRSQRSTRHQLTGADTRASEAPRVIAPPADPRR